MLNLMEQGDIEAGVAEQVRLERLANELRQPYFRLVTTHYGASRALLLGGFDEADELMAESLRLAEELHVAGTAQSFAVQFATLNRERGRLEALEPVFVNFSEQYERVPAWQTAIAILYAETDQRDKAQAMLDELAADGFVDFPEDFTWTISMGLLSEVCAYVGDRTRAAMLYDLLLPYEDRLITVGAANTYWGSVHLYLEMLAATLGREEEAERRLERALELHVRAGAAPFASRTRYQLARLKTIRDGPGDAERASLLIEQVVAEAGALGMARLVQQAGELSVR